MPRSVLYARLHLAALFVTYAGWMLAAGFFGSRLVFGSPQLATHDLTLLAYSVGLTVLLAVLLHLRLPVIALQANWYPLRASGWAAVLGGFALWLGAGLPWREALGVRLFGGPPEPNTFVLIRAVFGLGLVIAIFAIALPKHRSTPLFLTDRKHIGNWETRQGLVVGFVHAMVVALSIGLIASRPRVPAAPFPFPESLLHLGAGYVVGILLASRQKYPQRQMGLAVWSVILAAMALLCIWCAPLALWPAAFLGICVGLAHLPSRSVVLSSAPPDQRALALVVLTVLQILGVGIGLLIVWGMSRAGVPGMWRRGAAFIAVFLTALASIWFLRRELFELTLDMTMGLNYPIRAYGPGVLTLPARGPALIVANHHAMFDPLWLSKIVPMKVTALMTSKVFDLPIISFIVKKVVCAIRVPDIAFRREAPEIHDAVAALRRGQTVMIFPEGWLRRKENMPMRRFGQGAFQILKMEPATPVIACWIEGGWGSYTSYRNGPPGKGKPFDIRPLIRIGVCVPEELPADILQDQRSVRGYLMNKVVEARNYLDLPPIDVPEFASGEEEEE